MVVPDPMELRPMQNNQPNQRYKPTLAIGRFVPDQHNIPPTDMEERNVPFGGFGTVSLRPRYTPPAHPGYRGPMGPPPPRPFPPYAAHRPHVPYPPRGPFLPHPAFLRRPLPGMARPPCPRRPPFPLHFMPPHMRPHLRPPHPLHPPHPELARLMALRMRPMNAIHPVTHRPPPSRPKKTNPNPNNNSHQKAKKRNSKPKEPKPKEPKPLPNPEDSFLEDMNQPWITMEILYEFNKKQHLSQVARYTRCDADWTHFKYQRERCHAMIRMSRQRYLDHLEKEAERIAEENKDFAEDDC